MPSLCELTLLHNIQFDSDVFRSTRAYSTGSRSPTIRYSRSRSSSDSDREGKGGEVFL